MCNYSRTSEPDTLRTPLISVVMAVHNGELFLEQAVHSVLTQTQENWEFVIINDGSNDQTNEILSRYMDSDSRLIVVDQEKSGLTASLNRALKISKGRYIARMDSDDICVSARFEKQLRFLEIYPDVVAVGSYAMFIDSDGDPVALHKVPLSHEAIDRLHLSGVGGGLLHPSVMMRRTALESLGGYREKFCTSQDYDLWLRMAEVGRLANIPEPLIQYRLHVGAITFSRRKEQERNAREILENALRRRGLPPVQTRHVFLAQSDAFDEITARRLWSSWAFKDRNFRIARKHAWFVLRKRPYQCRSWLLLATCLLGRLAHTGYRSIQFCQRAVKTTQKG